MRRAAVGFGARLAALVLSAAVFSGCATPGKLKITPLWAPKLTTDEQREAQIIEDAFARFVANERAHGAAGLELPRILIGGGAPASYTQGYILLPRRALSGGPDHMNVRLYWHIIISHEGGHLYYADARDCPVRQKARCEWNANAEAVGILSGLWLFLGHVRANGPSLPHGRCAPRQALSRARRCLCGSP